MGRPEPRCAAFHTIFAYSPYENMRAQDYPAILALAGSDRPSRALLGAGKMDRPAAPPAHRSQADRLPTNLDAGHAGAAGRFDRLKEIALTYAFAIKIAARGLRAVLDVIAQFGDRAEPQNALRQLRLDRTVRIKRVSHAVDNAGLEDRDRRRRVAADAGTG